jgi:hypothetical protein
LPEFLVAPLTGRMHLGIRAAGIKKDEKLRLTKEKEN